MRTVGRSGFLQEPLRVRGCRSEYLTMSGFVDCRASLPFLISQSSCNYRFFSHSLCFFFLLIAIRYHRKQLRVISFSLSLPFLFLLFWRTDKCVCCGPRSARRPACSCCLGGGRAGMSGCRVGARGSHHVPGRPMPCHAPPPLFC